MPTAPAVVRSLQPTIESAITVLPRKWRPKPSIPKAQWQNRGRHFTQTLAAHDNRLELSSIYRQTSPPTKTIRYTTSELASERNAAERQGPLQTSQPHGPGLHPPSRRGSAIVQSDEQKQTTRAIRSLNSQPAKELIAGRYNVVQPLVKKLLVEYGEKPAAYMYEALVRANLDAWDGSAGEVSVLLADMLQQALVPDVLMWHSVLQVLSVHPDYLLRAHVIHELRESWHSLTRDGWHDLLVGLLRDRQIEMALDQFKTARISGVEVSPWMYGLLIHILCEIGEFDEILGLLQAHETPDKIISPMLWTHILDCAARALHHPLTTYVFDRRVRPFYTNPPVGICTSILHIAARHGDARLAMAVFQILARRSGAALQCHHYEALVDTYAVANDVRSALSVLSTMKRARLDISPACTRTMFKILRDDPEEVEMARRSLESLWEEGCPVPIQAVNLIMEVYDFHGSHESILELDSIMTDRDFHYAPDAQTYKLCNDARSAIDALSSKLVVGSAM